MLMFKLSPSNMITLYFVIYPRNGENHERKRIYFPSRSVYIYIYIYIVRNRKKMHVLGDIASLCSKPSKRNNNLKNY
jgi:hypothetical protein